MRNSSWTPARRSFSCADEDCTADANLSVAHNGPCGHVGTSRPQRAARIVRSVPKPTCERRGYRQYRGYIAGLFVSTLTLAVLGLAVLFQTATRQFAADPVPAQISTANPIADRTVESPSLPLAEPTQAAADSTPESPVTASVNTDHSEVTGVKPGRSALSATSRDRGVSIQRGRSHSPTASSSYHRYPRAAAKMFEVPWLPSNYD
jgi:hypothetical protein